MFSVIIPLYNKAAYVEKAIQSVLAQTYQEFELIVIDDGSTDDSLKNLRSTILNLLLTKKEISIIEQENQGVSTARNNAVRLAKYDFIAFLDADDWWEPTYLEEMKGLIEKYPQAGIYGSSYYKVKNGKQIPANIGVEEGFESGLINYFQVYTRTLYMPLTSITSIIKKTVFDSEKGFKATLKLGEDFDLWVRVALNHSVAFVNKPLAYYNQDVELQNRAVGSRFYKPEEHMIFTDYGVLNSNPDFRLLFEKLALYTLLPYYLDNLNQNEVELILKGVNWKNHSYKYRLYYLILPKFIVKFWLLLNRVGSKIKSVICK